METPPKGKDMKKKNLKFCGKNGGELVECGPGECYQHRGECKQHLRGLIQINHHHLQRLRRELIVIRGELTPQAMKEAATEEYGDVVGLLICLMQEEKNHDRTF